VARPQGLAAPRPYFTSTIFWYSPGSVDRRWQGKADRTLLETFRSRYLRGLDEPDGDA